MGGVDSGVRVKVWASNWAWQAPSWETAPPASRYWYFALKSAMRSDLVAAFRTELGSSVNLGTALAALCLGPQRLAALRTELCSLRARTARWTQSRCLAGQVQV